MSRDKLSLLVLAALIGLLVGPVLAGAQPMMQGPDGNPPGEEPAEGMEVQADLAPGFYYQGVLTEAGQPVNATRQMEFQLWDAATGGNPVGSTIAQSVQVSNGQFSVSLTWGAGQIDGKGLWLRVRAMDGAGAWQDLGRKEIRAVPYAMSLLPGAVVTDRGSLTTTLKLDGGVGLSARGFETGVVGHAWGPGEWITPTGGQFTSDNGPGVYGQSGKTYGVQGQACNSPGCYGGWFTGYTGVQGWSTTSHGVRGKGCDNTGCYGGYFTGDSGIYAEEQHDEGSYAGYFVGDVTVTNQLDVGGAATFAKTMGITGALDVGGPAEFDKSVVISGVADVNNLLEANSLQLKDTAQINGSLIVGGPAIGFFPRPAWDSGWEPVSQGASAFFQHNRGGNTDNYVVDLQCKDTDSGGFGVSIAAYGGDIHCPGLSQCVEGGVWWQELTTTSIIVKRPLTDEVCEQVRLRIWVYK